MNAHTSINQLNDALLRTTVAAQSAIVSGRAHLGDSRDNERGEGVISVALAVLIMAALAAAMWLAYKAMWDDASTRTANIVTKVGA